MSEVENKREMVRTLKGDDIFVMTSIIGKIGVRNVMACMNTMEVQEVLKSGENLDEDSLKEKIGSLIIYGILDVILVNMEKCSNDINRLMARLYDMAEKDMKDIEAADYLDMLIDVVKSENFADFFKRACESAKRVM